jgi:hypothetical protein
MAARKGFARARRDDLVVEKVGDETLIYDLRTHRAHCLNQTASIVWQLSDGKTGIDRILERIQAEVNPKATAEVVIYALDRLGKAKLLDRTREPSGSPVTRRQLVRASAVALPLITSLIAPTVAMAQSSITWSECANSDGAYGDNRVCCSDVGRRCRRIFGIWICLGSKC